MSNIFLSYRFTGENLANLSKLLGGITKELRGKGHDVFCSLEEETYFSSQNMTSDEIYSYCLKRQEESDIFLPLIKSQDKSTGMELELEKARELGQHCALLIKEGLGFQNFRDYAKEIIEYNSIPSLYHQINRFF